MAIRQRHVYHGGLQDGLPLPAKSFRQTLSRIKCANVLDSRIEKFFAATDKEKRLNRAPQLVRS